jgi:hypothetical protein
MIYIPTFPVKDAVKENLEFSAAYSGFHLHLPEPVALHPADSL